MNHPNQDSEKKPKEAKEKSEAKEPKKILIEEVTEEVKTKNSIKEPKYKTEKNRTHWKVFIQLGLFQDPFPKLKWDAFS